MTFLVIGLKKALRQSVAMAVVAVTSLASGTALGWGPDLDRETLSVVGLHVGTYHDNGPYENFNPGVYWVHNNWTAGTYYNSVRTTTVYAGYTWSWKTPTLPVVDSVTLTGAIATGYPNTIDGTDLSLLVLPSARINLSPKVGLRLTLLPYIKRYNPATSIHFSIEQSF